MRRPRANLKLRKPRVVFGVRGIVSSVVSRLRLGVLLAVVSFAIYACTVFALPQVLKNAYPCERSSIAAAATNFLFGTRPGTVDPRLLEHYLAASNFSEPLQQVLDETRVALPWDGRASHNLLKTISDGNGVGYLVFATMAFRLFGLHAWALLALMLVLMAISAIAFLRRFGGEFAGVVVLYFGVLTAMLFTPLVWDPSYSPQIPVGGIRYFPLLTVLPAFHLLLEILDHEGPRQSVARLYYGWLAVQAVILGVAALVRGNAIALVGVIALVLLVVAWKNRRNPGRLRVLRGKATIMAVAGLGLTGAIALTLPQNYLTEGRFGTVVWHRITESLGTNPSFPFPGVDAMFDCKQYVSEGIQPGYPDRNGHCIFVDYLLKHDIPIERANPELYGSRYETALRDAFFKIASRYPREVLVTFAYYKPMYILASLQRSLVPNFNGDQSWALNPMGHPVTPYPLVSMGLLLSGLAIMAMSIVIIPLAGQDWRQIAVLGLISALWTIPPYLAVWAVPYTAADLLFYCLFLAVLGLAAVPARIRLMLPRGAAVPKPAE
jgi:hypothetical protein